MSIFVSVKCIFFTIKLINRAFKYETFLQYTCNTYKKTKINFFIIQSKKYIIKISYQIYFHDQELFGLTFQ